MIKKLLLLALLLMCMCLNSCTLLRLQQEVKILNQVVTVKGNIINPYPDQGTVMLGAIQVRSWTDFAVVDGDVFYNDHEFNLHLLPGHYLLLAFQDRNNDGEFQPTENVGWYGDPWQLISLDNQNIEGIDIVMHTPEVARKALPELYAYNLNELKVEVPEISFDQLTTLDNPLFSVKNARMGLWEPIRFIQTVPSGFYFLEPYRPVRVPVIFVHGVSGHPAIWKYLIDRIDCTRFQPWVFYYPSGLRIESLGHWLSAHLYQLQGRYGFDHVYIVAHSMGGLVSRVAVNDFINRDRGEMIKLFVTLSTPWGGHKLAQKGLSLSPVIIPNWHDMDPASEMLKNLFTTSLPESLPYGLFFSYRGGGSILLKDNSDGVIALQSQLRRQAQDAATLIRGFDEDHSSILESDEVAKQLNLLLERRHAETETGKIVLDAGD